MSSRNFQHENCFSRPAWNPLYDWLRALTGNSWFIPVTNLITGSAALAQTASATAAASTAATSAASFIGSRITIANYKLDQCREADNIAINLSGRLGWSRSDIASALITTTRVMDYDEWSNDLRVSAKDIFKSNSAQNNITGLNVSSPINGGAAISVRTASGQATR